MSTETFDVVAAESLRLTRRIAAMSALARSQPTEVRPGSSTRPTKTWPARPATSARRSFTPWAPAAWAGRARSALGWIRDCACTGSGLRVADASVMPTITSGNTNSATLMIADRAAERLAAGHQG